MCHIVAYEHGPFHTGTLHNLFPSKFSKDQPKEGIQKKLNLFTICLTVAMQIVLSEDFLDFFS